MAKSAGDSPAATIRDADDMCSLPLTCHRAGGIRTLQHIG
jgi:hypothetical protein